MNTQQIARHLLNRRNAMNPAIYPGEMIASIGSEAMQEALQKRWLVANYDSGLLQVSIEGGKIDEMRGVSDKCPQCGNVECACSVAPPPNVSHGFAFEHALRRHDGTSLQEAVRASDEASRQSILEASTKEAIQGRDITPEQKRAELGEASRSSSRLIRELLSPGTGHDNDGGLKAVPTPSPSTPPAAAALPPKPVTPAGTGATPLGSAVKTPDGNLEIEMDPSNPASKRLAQQITSAR